MDYDAFLSTSPVGRRVELTLTGKRGTILSSEGSSGVALLYRVELEEGGETTVADTNFRLL